ncbi:Hypothetical predicted protein [Lecanosticta acicola]|uniref:Uncharacterized protein n=1 Tax=Lecanosticta acicola TaxID=111012 RepID=A0AAI9E8V5_9PEZI|nr:Hypothetical predicted protein [Lecanosticta acicola]
MASTAAETAGPVPVCQTKKTRPNPARRRTAKARLETRNVSSEATTGYARASAVSSKSVEHHQAKRAAPAPRPSQCQVQNKPDVRNKDAKGDVKQTSTSVKPRMASKASSAQANASKEKMEGSSGWTGPLALATPAFMTGGLVGCAAGAVMLLSAGLWKDFGGVESAILAARTAKLCMDNLCEDVITSLKAGTYSAPEALDMLRRTTLAYASAIPGGAPFVERMFREVDVVRKQRGREVDQVVAETYTQLEKAGKRGAGAAEIHNIIVDSLMKLAQFTGRATQDIIARNPKLRPYREGAARALRPPPEPKVPTVKLNMVMNHKQTVGA